MSKYTIPSESSVLDEARSIFKNSFEALHLSATLYPIFASYFAD